jgi:hypothetical protein
MVTPVTSRSDGYVRCYFRALLARALVVFARRRVVFFGLGFEARVVAAPSTRARRSGTVVVVLGAAVVAKNSVVVVADGAVVVVSGVVTGAAVVVGSVGSG